MEKFKTQLKVGQHYEKEFYSLYSRGKTIRDYSFAQGRNKQFDVMIETLKGRKFFEIKSERATITGNIAIEFSYDGQPSGINATLSDYWVHFIVNTDRILLIPVKKLKRYITEKKPRIVTGGDGNKSKMYLIPVWSLIDNCLCCDAMLMPYFKKVKFKSIEYSI